MTLDWQAVQLTLTLAFTTMICLLLIATPLAWWMARSKHWSVPFVSAICTLPLVLPPTVLGFYLLVFLGPQGPLGTFAESLNIGPLVFSFSGLVIGSIVYSLPFAVQPLVNAFQAIDPRLFEVAKRSDRVVSINLKASRCLFLNPVSSVLQFFPLLTLWVNSG